jgi:hypothetical protein
MYALDNVPPGSSAYWETKITNTETTLNKTMNIAYQVSCSDSSSCLKDWCKFQPKDNKTTSIKPGESVIYRLTCGVPLNVNVSQCLSANKVYESDIPCDANPCSAGYTCREKSYTGALALYPDGYKNIQVLTISVTPSKIPINRVISDAANALANATSQAAEKALFLASMGIDQLTYPVVCMSKNCYDKPHLFYWDILKEPFVLAIPGNGASFIIDGLQVWMLLVIALILMLLNWQFGWVKLK